jgi:hypothetical protein
MMAAAVLSLLFSTPLQLHRIGDLSWKQTDACTLLLPHLQLISGNDCCLPVQGRDFLQESELIKTSSRSGLEALYHIYNYEILSVLISKEH